MKVNPEIFRAYDLRGLVGSELNDEIVEHIGKAFGTFLKRKGITGLVVGRDSRASGESFSKAMIKGLNWAGANVIDIGMTLVGTFYWSQYFLKRQGGAYISASHNPPEYNGFKFANDYSETLVTAGMRELLRMVQEDDYEKGAKTGTVKFQSINENYFADIVKRVPLKKKFKVLIDGSCATAGALAPELFRKAGCEVVEKNCVVDSSFPLGVADPTSGKIAKRLSGEVLEANADVGFNYDADGDRIGIVDNKGTILWNDILVALAAKDVLSEHPGATIMFNTLCSKAVTETILASGGVPFMWRTGHSFLKKKNQEVKAAYIGELSGHFFFSADFYNHDDGLYATMRLLHYLAGTGLSLHEEVEKLPKYISSPEIKIYCADSEKAALMKKISPIFKAEFPKAEVIDDERAGDGVRLDLPDAMAVIRYSQNGPYLTIKFEAKTKKRYDELKNYIGKLLHSYKEVGWDNKINLNVASFE